ncbi:MAG: hypothetical protein LQ348_006512 [Seirophora lacunosa]|nr:MAG: hypothetical protein LQ344_003572 [Seirophora lacunosa]KAI4173684.1 MAG: hypothetical protein LQ348_006512 [Seirophora lacunosa]
MPPLRIGFVPEHFSTPLHFAQTHFSLQATLIPFPSGTGHMVTSLRAGELDLAIGLTEGWVAALAPPSPSPSDPSRNDFKIVGTYVESPLCWAISTGSTRDDITSAADLHGKALGVSRVGSGSYVMGFVLADREGWLRDFSSAPPSDGPPKQPFDVKPLQNFENLRKAVNDKTADFFMWEYFTSKRYYGSAASPYPIKKVGEIYTPWSSWKIVARNEVVGGKEVEKALDKLNAGVKWFQEHEEEAVRYISEELDYEEEDAREWMKTVRFAEDVKGVESEVLEKTVATLKKAGVLGDAGRPVEEWVGSIKGR